MKASKFSNAHKAFILKQVADGVPVADIFRRAGISQAAYLNWKKKYEGLAPLEMHRLTSASDGLRQKAASPLPAPYRTFSHPLSKCLPLARSDNVHDAADLADPT